MKDMRYLVVFVFFGITNLFSADQVKSDRTVSIDDIKLEVRCIADADSNKYFPGADKEMMIEFETACIVGITGTVQSMLKDGIVRSEDAGLIYIDHSTDSDKSIIQLNPECVRSIAQIDKFAVWKGYKLYDKNLRNAPGIPNIACNALPNGFVQRCLDCGFAIAYVKRNYEYVPTLHNFVYACFNEYPPDAKLNVVKILLEKGANPYKKAICHSIVQHRTPVDIFEIILKIKDDCRDANIFNDTSKKINDWCKTYQADETDTNSLYRPGTPFYTEDSQLLEPIDFE